MINSNVIIRFARGTQTIGKFFSFINLKIHEHTSTHLFGSKITLMVDMNTRDMLLIFKTKIQKKLLRCHVEYVDIFRFLKYFSFGNNVPTVL